MLKYIQTWQGKAMKLFLDTAHIDHIKKWVNMGIIDGITTNPTHLSQEGTNPTEKIREICALINGPVSVEITEFEAETAYIQAKEISKLADNIVVKIPCHLRYYPIIKKLIQEGIKLNITLVFTLSQGLAMCKLGAEYISPFVGRLEDIDASGLALVGDLVTMVTHYSFSTRVLAASIRTVGDLHTIITLGAHCATVPAYILEKSFDHPLLNQGIATFLTDWKKLAIDTFP